MGRNFRNSGLSEKFFSCAPWTRVNYLSCAASASPVDDPQNLPPRRRSLMNPTSLSDEPAGRMSSSDEGPGGEGRAAENDSRAAAIEVQQSQQSQAIGMMSTTGTPGHVGRQQLQPFRPPTPPAFSFGFVGSPAFASTPPSVEFSCQPFQQAQSQPIAMAPTARTPLFFQRPQPMVQAAPFQPLSFGSPHYFPELMPTAGGREMVPLPPSSQIVPMIPRAPCSRPPLPPRAPTPRAPTPTPRTTAIVPGECVVCTNVLSSSRPLPARAVERLGGALVDGLPALFVCGAACAQQLWGCFIDRPKGTFVIQNIRGWIRTMLETDVCVGDTVELYHNYSNGCRVDRGIGEVVNIKYDPTLKLFAPDGTVSPTNIRVKCIGGFFEVPPKGLRKVDGIIEQPRQVCRFCCIPAECAVLSPHEMFPLFVVAAVLRTCSCGFVTLTCWFLVSCACVLQAPQTQQHPRNGAPPNGGTIRRRQTAKCVGRSRRTKPTRGDCQTRCFCGQESQTHGYFRSGETERT